MTVALKSGVNALIGKVLTFDGDGYAILATPANFDISKGYGVVIHESVNSPSSDSDGDKLVQVATGNAYVAMNVHSAINPFQAVDIHTNSEIIAFSFAGFAGNTATLAELTAFANDVKQFLGRCYGAPGQQVNPRPVSSGGIVAVRLGQ